MPILNRPLGFSNTSLSSITIFNKLLPPTTCRTSSFFPLLLKTKLSLRLSRSLYLRLFSYRSSSRSPSVFKSTFQKPLTCPVFPVSLYKSHNHTVLLSNLMSSPSVTFTPFTNVLLQVPLFC
jgi:hypothetical protein